MEFILGLLTAIVLFLCVFIGYLLGTRQAKKKVETKPIDEEEKQRIERFNKHFKNLFNYDVETALKRKEVK